MEMYNNMILKSNMYRVANSVTSLESKQTNKQTKNNKV